MQVLEFKKIFKGHFAHIKTLGAILSLVLFLAMNNGCTFSTPQTKNPSPGLEQKVGVVQDGVLSIKKSFFGIEIDQNKNTWKRVKKNWLCGWAPVNQSGLIKNFGGLSASPYSSRHCNVQFRISKDGSNLEARELNVDALHDIEQWPLMFTIPIRKHYFYEKTIDQNGREQNSYAKVTDKKNWQLSPVMDLDLKGIRVYDLRKKPGVKIGYAVTGNTLTDVHDIEFEVKPEANFLGFSATQLSSLFGNYSQLEMRFNFLEYKGTPGFKKTPYHISTAEHMNVLHVLGGTPDGIHDIKYAAHWDFSKPVEICLNGFPDDWRNYKQIAYDVIEEVNSAMRKVLNLPDGQKVLVVGKENPGKVVYDLRCPSITWVDEPILALRAPLGIGLVNADYRTGEILWGGAVVWGGLIDYIVNNDSEAVFDALSRSNGSGMASSFSPSELYLNEVSDRMNQVFAQSGPMPKLSLKDKIADFEMSDLPMFREEPKKGEDETLYLETIKKRNMILHGLEKPQNVKNRLEPEGLSLSAFSYQQSLLLDLTKGTPLSGLNQVGQSNFRLSAKQKSDLNGKNHNKYSELLSDDYNWSHGVIGVDNTLEKRFTGWQAAFSEKGMTLVDKQKAARSIIKNVMLHEVYHVLGLGHNFAGNKLPEKGTLPEEDYNTLVKASHKHLNYTTIMDYPSGYTEVSLDYDDVKTQSQDMQVLRFLYNQEVATYRHGDSVFTYFPVSKSGIIENSYGGGYKTSYLPQCSDWSAWKATDPYCRRWDRGYDAVSIVEENYNYYMSSVVSRMVSFSEASGWNPYWANYWVWARTYGFMNNNRTFYDHMRYTLQNNPIYNSIFKEIKRDKEALFNFSKFCEDPLSASVKYKTNFAKLFIEPTVENLKKNNISDFNGLVLNNDLKKNPFINSFYSQGLQSLEAVMKKHDVKDWTSKKIAQVDSDLKEKGIQLTELHKLCIASKKSIEQASVMLSLKGPDYTLMDYDAATPPTGLRGANARKDHSRAWARFRRIGMLPVKIAAMDVFTNFSSTFGVWTSRGRYWIPKPKFNDPNIGKYGYFSLFPYEFTETITAALENNMGFGNSTFYDSATMSLANLYMPYFLFRTFYRSNDKQVNDFNESFVTQVRGQTKFNVRVRPVILSKIDKKGESKDLAFGFNAEMWNSAKRQYFSLPQAYVLPENKVIIQGNEGQILLPFSSVKFLNDSILYVWVIEVTYDKNLFRDKLEGRTIKDVLTTLNTNELTRCMDGQFGLSEFFNKENPKFKGFKLNPEIRRDEHSQLAFQESVQVAFDSYHEMLKENGALTQKACEESRKGVGLVGATAMSLRGWILSYVFDYLR